MRWLLVPTLAALAVPAPGQLPRLVDTIERPMAYLCLEAMPAASGARQPGPVQRLLADPSLDALLGADPGAPASGAARALALVRGVLARSSGELELVLTGVVPGAGQPLLLLRARLQRSEADSLQLALDGDQLAEPRRRLGGRQTYRLRGAAAAEGPGQEVELSLVGADLLVGNDSTAMREVLEPPPAATTASGARAVLSADARFTSLRQQLPVAPGALWLYGDWPRLAQRFAAGIDGVPGWLLGSSGLGSASSVLAAVGADQADFGATLLLDFAPGPRGLPPRRGPGAAGKGPFRGWFDAVEPVPARALLAELPAGGLGGLVLSVDLARVAARSPEGSHLLHDLYHAFERYGLDLDRNVLARLGERGAVQLHVGRGAGGAEVSAVYTMRTRNKKAASDLFADLRRVAEPAGLGAVVVRDGAGRERRPIELLQLRPTAPHGHPSVPSGHGVTVFVAAHEDALLFAADDASLAAVVEELRRPTKPRARRGERVGAALGGEPVAGLFDVDLQPWFDQLAAVFAGAGARVDLSTLPGRHVGHLDLQHDGDQTVLRVRVLSSR